VFEAPAIQLDKRTHWIAPGWMQLDGGYDPATDRLAISAALCPQCKSDFNVFMAEKKPNLAKAAS